MPAAAAAMMTGANSTLVVQQYSRTMPRVVVFFSYPSTGAGPAGRAVRTGAGYVSLPSRVRHEKKKENSIRKHELFNQPSSG